MFSWYGDASHGGWAAHDDCCCSWSEDSGHFVDGRGHVDEITVEHTGFGNIVDG